jgi:hypothetical protein
MVSYIFIMQQKIHLVKIKYLVYLYMSCGNYCFQRQWECRPGKLKRLSEVQQQPSPTRDYGSDGARSNYVMRRVVRTNATRNKLQEISGFGPLFGLRKLPSTYQCGTVGETETWRRAYRSNSGSGGEFIYWKKIMSGPINLLPGSATSCSTENCRSKEDDAGGLVRANNCFLNGKAWLWKRRGL